MIIIRTTFAVVLGLCFLALPVGVRAQRPAIPVIGLLATRTATDTASDVAAFRAGLAEAGYVEQQSVLIEYRWADGQYDRLPVLAADLVRRQVAVIFCAGSPAALAGKAATKSIPVIFLGGSDPVKSGLVESISHPGANVTGISLFTGQLGAKQLGLLREFVPRGAVVAVLVNPNSPVTETFTKDVQVAAVATGHRIHVVNANSARDLDKAFATITGLHPGALLVGADPFFLSRREQIVALVARNPIPAIYELREYAEVGGLMSYGASIADAYRQAGRYTGRVLKGEKPANLPVMQPTKFELVLNLKTATTLGLKMPPSLLLQADQIIE